MNEIWIPVIVAIIGAVSGVVGVILSNNKSNRDMATKLDTRQAVFEAHVTEQIDGIKTDVRRLEGKQDKHNNIVETTYELKATVERQGDELKRHNERIKQLEVKGA